MLRRAAENHLMKWYKKNAGSHWYFEERVRLENQHWCVVLQNLTI